MAAYVLASNESIKLRIDSDNDSNTKSFTVKAGNPAQVIFDVREDGRMLITGSIQSRGTVYLDNAGSGDIVRFEFAGSPKAAITAEGTAVFSAAGLRLKADYAGLDPNGRLTGDAGDLILWHNGTSFEIWACRGGTSWNNATA